MILLLLIIFPLKAILTKVNQDCFSFFGQLLIYTSFSHQYLHTVSTYKTYRLLTMLISTPTIFAGVFPLILSTLIPHTHIHTGQHTDHLIQENSISNIMSNGPSVTTLAFLSASLAQNETFYVTTFILGQYVLFIFSSNFTNL